MPSPRRRECDSQIYHITARGVGRMNIFEDDDDRGEFLRLLSAALEATTVEAYAWCLMSNHVHLLLHGPLESISEAMRRTLGRYAVFFNKKHDHVGHLFQGRFFSVPVIDDPQLMELVRYIHQNPAHAGALGCGGVPLEQLRGLHRRSGEGGRGTVAGGAPLQDRFRARRVRRRGCVRGVPRMRRRHRPWFGEGGDEHCFVGGGGPSPRRGAYWCEGACGFALGEQGRPRWGAGASEGGWTLGEANRANHRNWQEHHPARDGEMSQKGLRHPTQRHPTHARFYLWHPYANELDR